MVLHLSLNHIIKKRELYANIMNKIFIKIYKNIRIHSKNNLFAFSLFFIFFLMLAKMDLTKIYALKGLNLWLFTIFPSLLPFTIISSLLLYTNAFSKPLFLFKRITKLSFNENVVLIIICGIFCGCPIGAKLANDAYIANKINKQTATFLSCALNSLSPAFIISFALPSVINTHTRIVIFAIIIISNIISGYFIIKYIKIADNHKLYSNPSSNSIKQNIISKPNKQLLEIYEKCIISSLITQAKIGGYIIFFSCISGLFCQTLNLTPYSSMILNSTLEISSGLGAYNVFPITTQYIALISALTSFGGICTICQIISCINDLDVPKKILIYSKIISSIITYVIILHILSF